MLHEVLEGARPPRRVLQVHLRMDCLFQVQGPASRQHVHRRALQRSVAGPHSYLEVPHINRLNHRTSGQAAVKREFGGLSLGGLLRNTSGIINRHLGDLY